MVPLFSPPALKTTFYYLAKAFFWTLFLPYFRLSMKGRENFPRRGGLLVAANHISYIDPLLLGVASPRRIHFLMGADYFQKPVVHLFSRLMDVVPVDRDKPAATGPIRRCLKLLAKGSAVGIFPEGRRSRTGTLLEPQAGMGLLAARAGVPVVPVAIVGTREAFPPGKFLPHPRKVTLYAGPPLTFPESASAEEVTRRTWEAIVSLFKGAGRDDYLADDNPEGVGASR